MVNKWDWSFGISVLMEIEETVETAFKAREWAGDKKKGCLAFGVTGDVTCAKFLDKEMGEKVIITQGRALS
jgi:hypothetical protein